MKSPFASPPHKPHDAPITFQQAVSSYLDNRFPRQLADTNDNVGLTVGALANPERGESTLIVLCVDLTEQVLADAISRRADYIVSYSPMPDAPVRALSTDDVVGRILLRCARHQIAVHSIHTACDSAGGGINDWLARSLTPGAVSTIRPDAEHIDAGQGRRLECEEAVPLSRLIERVKQVLDIKFVRLALGAIVDEQSLAKAQESCFVKSVGVQVGEGSAVLRDCTADVFVTSEMTHAEVVDANSQGIVVILAGQSTIERAYMRQLRTELDAEFASSDWNVKVRCSDVDSNPLSVV